MKLMNIIIISLMLLCNSCDNDKKDDFSTNPFIGKWELKSIIGGFSPIEIFQENEILWTFNTDESLEIKINKELSNVSKLPIKVDTTLSYSYDTINISIGTNKFEYKLEGKTLKLYDNLASDGIMLELEKK